jgi:putative MATE family efflux protein
MKMALFMNLVNLFGNALLLYGFKMGVAGIAIATLVSRASAAVIIIGMLRNQKLLLHLPEKLDFRLDLKMQKRILRIGIPNGLESALFEFGKLLVLSLVATLGTASIAANAVGNYVGTFAIMAGFAVGNATITVISQCVGAREYDQVRYYKKKMMRICYALIIASNVIVITLLPLILKIYGLSDEASHLAFTILVYHGIVACFIWGPSFLLPYVLRAANDVAPAMIIAMVSVWVFRVVVAYILVKIVGLGLLGVWIAMTTDWAFRSICFTIRYKQEKWLIKSELIHT